MAHSPIRFKSEGDFKETIQFLKKASEGKYLDALNRYGQQGVEALRAATPKDTGLTADSWSYEVFTDAKYGSVGIAWSNSHVEKGWANIAILLQYGHGTRNGGYVKGQDYINPAIRPIFDAIAENVWKELTQN